MTAIAKVFGSNSSAHSTMCAINQAGDLWCWGWNGSGVVGNGTTSNQNYAAPVLTGVGGSQFANVAQVALGEGFACARKTDGTVWCWGDNTDGELGDGSSTSQSLYPVQVIGLPTSATALDAYGATACAVTSDENIWCWGSANQDQLGNGVSSGDTNVPTRVLTARWQGRRSVARSPSA